MNIYLVSRTDKMGYDTFDSFVCVAPDADTARKIAPAYDSTCAVSFVEHNEKWPDYYDCWVPFNKLHTLVVTKVGVADSNVMQVVCSSFNAG